MRIAYIFPGQGSQTIGMGKALAENFSAARSVFAEIDDALNQHLSRLMWDASPEELTRTTNAQPAIMACSMAALAVLQAEAGLNVAQDAAFVAGHSLGEYSALCAAGAFDVAQTAKLLRIRGDAMQQAMPEGEGAMAALLGLDVEQVETLVAECDCDIANDNAPGQVVISGTKAAIDAACIRAKELGAKRALPLNVSAAFHSRYMQPAAHVMQDALGQTHINPPTPAVVANVTAAPVQEPSAIRAALVAQVSGRVRWVESVRWMATQGITHMVELGEGKTLSGMIKRISPQVECLSVGQPADVVGFVDLYKQVA